MMRTLELSLLFEFTLGRRRYSMYSSSVCPPGYVRRGAWMHRLQSEGRKKLTKGAAISSFFHYASQANTTAWMQEIERIRRQSREPLYKLSNRRIQDNDSVRIHY